MRLPPDIKAKWVAALRSGAYEQGTGTMCTPRTAIDDSVRYCCLGVLQMVLDGDVERENSVPMHLPSLRWAGLHRLPIEGGPKWVPVVSIAGYLEEISIANDNGLTFDQIADLIEEQL